MLSYEFIDMDYSIEQEHGLSIPSIFERYGEEVFREWEAEALTRLAFEDKNVVEVADLEVCIECHSCQQMCPEKAIKVYPQIDEVLPSL